jgi:hypothetical protein
LSRHHAVIFNIQIRRILVSHIKSGIPVRISGSGGLESLGEVSIEEFDQKTRMMRGLQTFGIFLACAIVAIFIPLLHFVLVPGLLMAGIGFGFSAYQKTALVRGGKGVCPKCKNEFDIVQNPPNWPLKDVCSKCFENVKISLKE